MNGKHRSNADVAEGETNRDREREDQRIAAETAAARADETVEEETEETFDDAEELPQEDSD